MTDDVGEPYTIDAIHRSKREQKNASLIQQLGKREDRTYNRIGTT